MKHFSHCAGKLLKLQTYCNFPIGVVSGFLKKTDFDNSTGVSTYQRILELVSKELNHFGGIVSFFRDWAPGTLTGGK